MTALSRQAHVSDVIVVGAGAVGLAAAIALARDGRGVTLVGRQGQTRPGRTVAVMQGSVELLQRLGVWPHFEPQAAPLRSMRIVDATGSLFAPPPVLFRAEEIGLPAFGYNIDNAVLESGLREAAAAIPRLRIVAAAAARFTFDGPAAEVETEAGERIRAPLVVAADGRDSLARKSARIGVRTTEHPQRAMTALFTHTAPHADVSTEFHTREGPFTLVPMRGNDHVHRSSLVWVMSPREADRRRSLSPDAFTGEAEQQCGRLLGRMVLASGVGSFPILTRTAARLIGPRLVLLGEAAHALPPIGAQGLNLSFRDVDALAKQIARAASRGEDIGDVANLAAYAAARAGDVASRVVGVDLLNGSLLARGATVDLLRGAGLATLARVGPLRRLVMRRGLTPEPRRLDRMA